MKLKNESLAAIKRQIRSYAVGAQSLSGAQVKITTARELPPNEYDAIVKRLKGKLGREIFAERKIDPRIIGGIIIQYGDKIIDGSVARQLRQYNETMSKVDVKKIGVTNAI
ncbi:MAG: F0F1 ATP synthase subunit delta [Acidaminococcales bacterium]|jgi:F0F1-type ATP synthase delta subunit|nr:F0F1 ATP synthase subunit delta [Acidaminococcales bacterium]